MSNAKPFGDYLDNILEQPDALRATVAGIADNAVPLSLGERVQSGAIRSIILTGMGASYYALQPLTLELVAHAIPAQRIETSELIYHAPRLLDPRNLVIAVSQSGQSVEILKLLEQTRALRVPVLGVTNTPDSPLARDADYIVLTHAGTEFSVSCKTYIATLGALQRISALLTGQDTMRSRTGLTQAATAMETYLGRWEKNVATLRQELIGMEQLVLLGRGASLAAVGTGALILQEAAHFPAQAMSSAAMRHGPFEMIAPQLFALVFHGAPPTMELNRRLVSDIRAAGGHSFLVTESMDENVFSLPPVPPAMLPLLEILIPQMLSLALAERIGHTPGKFERISKVTTIE
ncbi:MAG TPA: SIS domain-containing protein [Anaerolineae bacterium]|nr:SIS domain-containing protein [Anaerolineae bacterium]